MTKTVVRSLPSKSNPCSNIVYNGKRACIEKKASNSFVDKTACALPWTTTLHPTGTHGGKFRKKCNGQVTYIFEIHAPNGVWGCKNQNQKLKDPRVSDYTIWGQK